MRLLPLTLAAAMVVAMPAFAQRVPPTNSLPLSQILAKIEVNQSVSSFRQIEWEDDGYWEIEFFSTKSSRPQRLRIDPVTGGSWSRR